MSRKILYLLPVVIAIVLGCSHSAWARMNPFDGNRQGIILSMGFGGGVTSISSRNLGISGNIAKGTVGIVYRLGFAPNDRWMFYGSYKSSIYASKIAEHYDDLSESIDDSKVSGRIGAFFAIPFVLLFTDQHLMMGVGTSYYFRRGVPSWFVDFAAGGAFLSDPYESEGVSPFPGGMHGGYSLSAGGGYEFARHAQAELQLIWSRASWETAAGKKN